MEEILNRIFEDLIDRVSGPMKFRLILQPLMAIIFAVRSGLEDAKEGKPAYFWALFTQSDHRRDMLRDVTGSPNGLPVIVIANSRKQERFGEIAFRPAMLALAPEAIIRYNRFII